MTREPRAPTPRDYRGDFGPLFAPADEAKMSAACRRIADHADGVYRSKREWAAISGMSEHAFSARASELRRKGYTVDRVAPNPGSGEVCGSWLYRVTRS